MQLYSQSRFIIIVIIIITMMIAKYLSITSVM